jgi:hypothetical protein
MAREVSSSAGFRFVCYRKDCQAFARFLQRPDVLDTAAGLARDEISSSRPRIEKAAAEFRRGFLVRTFAIGLRRRGFGQFPWPAAQPVLSLC